MVGTSKCNLLNLQRPLTDALRDFIAEAQQQPNADQTLRLYAHRIASQPGYWLQSEQNSALEDKIITLITQYVSQLPTLIDQINQDFERLGWQTIASKINDVIRAYFTKSGTLSNNAGMLGLLDKIYFAHRLIEEIHDHLMCLRGSPSIPWNMTAANLLMHQLLGANFSSRLDETAIELAEKLLSQTPKTSIADHKKGQTTVWPCFCSAHGLDVAF